MTALDFPDAPTPGDKFTAPGGIEWVFEDPLWVLAGTPGGGSGTPAVPDLWATFHPRGGPVGGTSSDKRPGFQGLNAPNGGFHIEPVLSELVVEEDGTYEIVITVGGLNGAALTGNAYMLLALYENGVERQARIHNLGASWNGWTPHFVADLKAGDQLDIALGGEFWSLFTVDSRFVPGGSFIRRIDPSPSSGGGGGSGGGGSDGFSFTQDTAPTATTAGQTWFDTSTGNSFVWFDGQWAQFAPGGGGGGGAVDPTAAPRVQTIKYAHPTILPTSLPGTNPLRSLALLESGSGVGPITTAPNGHEIEFRETGLYWVEPGYWSEGTLPQYFRVRATGNGLNNASIAESPVSRGFLLHIQAGTKLSFELEGVAGARADNPGIVITDLRRPA